MKKKPYVYVAIPVFNRLEYTKACLESLERSNYDKTIIVVCDDGSTDGTAEYLSKNHPEVVVLSGNGDLWWTGGINVCLKYILKHANSEDLVLTLNNDVIVGPEYIDEMVRVHHIHPNALIGSLAVFLNDPTRVETAESVHNWITAKKGPVNKFGEGITVKRQSMSSVPKLCGKGVLIPIHVFKAIGAYDQKNFPHYAADEDFSMRAKAAGFSLFFNYDAIVLSNVEATGIGTERTTPTLINFIRSLWSKRSPNFLLIRWRFTLRHCPILLIPSHLLLDFGRLTVGFLRRYLLYHYHKLTTK